MQLRKIYSAAGVALTFAAALLTAFPAPGGDRPADDGPVQQRRKTVTEEYQLLEGIEALAPEAIEAKSPDLIRQHLGQVRRRRIIALQFYVEQLESARRHGVTVRTSGTDSSDQLSSAVIELSQAEFDIAETRAERVTALKKWYRVACELEANCRRMRDAGALGGEKAAVSRSIAHRLQAEAALTSEIIDRDLPLPAP